MSNYFSKNLKFIRENKGIKQSEMLDLLGFHRTTWSNYENGRSNPSFDDLLLIAKYFDISLDELVINDLVDGGDYEKNKMDKLYKKGGDLGGDSGGDYLKKEVSDHKKSSENTAKLETATKLAESQTIIALQQVIESKNEQIELLKQMLILKDK